MVRDMMILAKKQVRSVTSHYVTVDERTVVCDVMLLDEYSLDH